MIVLARPAECPSGVVTEQFSNRPGREQGFGHASEMGAHTRPRPLTRKVDQTCPHRVQAYVADTPVEIGFVHRKGRVPPLPEVSRQFASCLNASRVSGGYNRHRPRHTRMVRRRGYKVDVIGHEAVGQNVHLCVAESSRGDLKPRSVVRRTEEDPLALIATLGDVVWHPRHDNPRGPGHGHHSVSNSDDATIAGIWLVRNSGQTPKCLSPYARALVTSSKTFFDRASTATIRSSCAFIRAPSSGL